VKSAVVIIERNRQPSRRSGVALQCTMVRIAAACMVGLERESGPVSVSVGDARFNFRTEKNMCVRRSILLVEIGPDRHDEKPAAVWSLGLAMEGTLLLCCCPLPAGWSPQLLERRAAPSKTNRMWGAPAGLRGVPDDS
jgi:hypothetical protein